jgi:hypothetical protein
MIRSSDESEASRSKLNEGVMARDPHGDARAVAYALQDAGLIEYANRIASAIYDGSTTARPYAMYAVVSSNCAAD